MSFTGRGAHCQAGRFNAPLTSFPFHQPADGIGPEVIDAGVEVLQALSDASGSFRLTFENFDWGSETYKKTGKYIPDGGLESLRNHDAILFGAVGAPGI